MPRERHTINLRETTPTTAIVSSYKRPTISHARRESEILKSNPIKATISTESQSEAFRERFKGKTHLIDKDGHLGVVLHS
jgi:hypothetical protein